jgi:hypothetical protein
MVLAPTRLSIPAAPPQRIGTPQEDPVLLLLAVLAMEQWRDQLPTWLQRLAERPSWLWNTGIGLIIGLSLLRWLLQR